MLHCIAVALLLVGCSLPAALNAAADDAAINTLTPDEAKHGWKLLFDGKDTKGWRVYGQKDAGEWKVEDGLLVSGHGDLITKKKYANFILSVDWKFAKGDNSGIIYRVVETNGPSWETGPEMQVLRNDPKQKLGRNDSGALYDVFAPTVNALKPASQWNTFKILVNGKHIEQYVNGTKVVDTDIGSPEWNKAIETSKWKGSKKFAAEPTGYIALQEHGGQCLFRNIKIKVLP